MATSATQRSVGKCISIALLMLVAISVTLLPRIAASESSVFNSVPYITLRNLLSKQTPESFYGDERSSPSVGVCRVQWDRSRVMSNIGEAVDFYLPKGDAKIVSISKSTTAAFWSDFKKNLNGEKPLLYVHGYNMSFEKACLRARELQQNLGLQNRLILFSWPSDGAVLNYTRDEADIAWSVLPLANVISELSSHFGAGGFDIAAHSIGGRGVVLAMSRVVNAPSNNAPSNNAHSKKAGNTIPLVDQLVLAATDMDAGRAAQHLSSISTRVSGITLYASSNDRALKFSQNLHGYPRLGQSGEHLAGLLDVDVIDATGLKVQRISGHLYHLANATVIKDLAELLNERKLATERSQLQRTNAASGKFWTLVAEPVE